MLTKTQSEVMSAVFCLCDGTGGCLISPVDILSVLPDRKKYTAERIDDTLSALHDDGYIDVISSERKGEKMYVISLKESGLTFNKSSKQKKRDVAFKIFLALVGATSTFVFGVILKAIFGD